MTQKLNESPQDKHKAMYGETNQANYLNNAKQNNSETKSRRVLFNDSTNMQRDEPPVSPFKDQSSKIGSMRENAYAPHSPVKSSFDYRA